jgi:plasmid stability protein
LATLHIRNVPDEVVAALKERARLSGRSLNAEVVQVLSESAARPKRSIDEVIESVRRRVEGMNLPPAGEGIAEDIRRARDERAEQIDRAISGES